MADKESLANKYRPNRFSEVVGQEQYVKSFQDIIVNNKHNLAQAIFLTGASGVGKTSLSMLYAKATLCSNRTQDEYEPCGVCDICTGKDESSIHYYSVSSATEARDVIDQLSDIARQLPTPRKAVRVDQNRRFIIIDETQLLSSESMSKLLDVIERKSAPTTSWILVSMDPQKLERRDPITKDAITSRCAQINLSSLSNEDIAHNLIKYYELLDEEAAYRLAFFSEGNMREAWNSLGLLLISYSIEEITEDLIVRYKIGNLSLKEVNDLWKYLESFQAVKAKDLLSKWSNEVTNSSILANILLESLLSNTENLNEDGLLLIKSISQWQMADNKYPLAAAIIPFLGKRVFSISLLKGTEIKKANTNPIKILAEAQLANGLNPLDKINNFTELLNLIQ
jgi:DNA polymerase III gamma/tau subunit